MSRRPTATLTAMIIPAAVLMVSACASYPQPAPDAPHATLILTRASPNRVEYRLGIASGPDEAYAMLGTVGHDVLLRQSTEAAFRVAPGQIAYLSVVGMDTNGYANTFCANRVSFVPRAGASYTIALRYRGEHADVGPELCQAVVTDRATSASPPDLVRVLYPQEK